MHHSINLKKQAVELKGTRTPGQTGIYRNALAKETLDHPNQWGVTTLYGNFQNGLKINPDGPCIGHRPFDPVRGKHGGYVWQTYRQVDKRVTAFGSGIMKMEQDFVKSGRREQWSLGIYSINRPEWYITEQAANAHNLVTVALYDTLGPSAVEFILNHADVPICVTTLDKISNLLKQSSKIPGLKVIISMDPLTSATANPPTPGSVLTTSGTVLRDWGQSLGVQILDFAQVEELGVMHPRPHNPPKPSDLCCICYTSGTTGDPKGALLTHANFIAPASVFNFIGMEQRSSDIVISYLPLAHCFERAVEISNTMVGGSIGFYRGDVLLLIEDIAELKPTVFPSVPRLYNRIFAKLQAQTVNAPGVVGALARKAVSDKLAALSAGQGYTHALWDRLLFGKVRNVLGGRVRVMITGSAPISKEVISFLRIAFCCDFHEGYGQTENAAYATMTVAGEYIPGHVGIPAACTELKLVDVPEMAYLSTDKPFPRGEVCLRGVNVFKGYHKDEKKTQEAIDGDGWLHTGDVGSISKRGTLSIIDRKKNIFKLAQGEYVAPERIENVLLLCPLVAQIYVHGDPLQSTLVAVVVPDPDAFLTWATGILKTSGAENTAAGTLKDLANNSTIRKLLLKELDAVGNDKKLRGFEFVKRIIVETESFSVENGCMTPTFKLKRQDLAKRYRKEIDEMYAELSASQPVPKL